MGSAIAARVQPASEAAASGAAAEAPPEGEATPAPHAPAAHGGPAPAGSASSALVVAEGGGGVGGVRPVLMSAVHCEALAAGLKGVHFNRGERARAE